MSKGIILAALAGLAAWGISRKIAEPAEAAQILPNTAAPVQSALSVLEAQVKAAEEMVQVQHTNLPGQVAVLEKPYLDMQVNYKDLDPLNTPTETANIVKVADAVKVHNILEASGLPAIGSSILAGTQSYAEAQGISYAEALERTTGIEATPELRQQLANAGIITQAEAQVAPAEAPAQTGYGGFASPEDFEEHYGYSYFIDLEPGGTLIPVASKPAPAPEPLPAIPTVINDLEPDPVPYNPYVPVIPQSVQEASAAPVYDAGGYDDFGYDAGGSDSGVGGSWGGADEGSWDEGDIW